MTNLALLPSLRTVHVLLPSDMTLIFPLKKRQEISNYELIGYSQDKKQCGACNLIEQRRNQNLKLLGVTIDSGKTKRRQPVKRDWPLFYCPSAGITMSLPSSMADFVPCDRLLQKAYLTTVVT